MSLHEVLVKEVYRVLKQCNGNKAMAARALKISIRTVRTWVRDNEELAEFRAPLCDHCILRNKKKDQ